MSDRRPPAVLIATKNARKAAELAALTSGLAGTVSLADWESAAGRGLAAPLENGRTFVANALIKARTYAAATGLTALADDSGLSVAALGGAPGVHSARFGGAGLTDRERALALLGLMRARRDRRAFFVTVLALVRPDGRALLWSGRLSGRIARSLLGGHGFGYDPVFRPAGCGLTLAQMSPERKNLISHRARAIRAFQADGARVRAFLAGQSL